MTTHKEQYRDGVREGLCGATPSQYAFSVASTYDKEVDCFHCVVRTEGRKEYDDMCTSLDSLNEDNVLTKQEINEKAAQDDVAEISSPEGYAAEKYLRTEKDFLFNFRDMSEAEVAVPIDAIPVMALLDGKKVRVGEGRINPTSMIFTATTDKTPEAETVLKEIKAAGRGGGYIEVSEVTLKRAVETNNPEK